MKTRHLLIIIIFSASLCIANHRVFADNTNNVEIQDIQVQPSTIKVGDIIKITATLVNNSPDPVYVSDQGSHDCGGAFFTVMFDNHIRINETGIACSYVALVEKLDSGKKYTGTSPGIGLVYIATKSGTVNATVTFPYEVRNQTDPNQSGIWKTISKSFLLTINDNSTQIIPANPNHYNPTNFSQYPMVPLKQFKSGVEANNVICRDDLQLLIEKHDGFPICVTLNTASRLSLLDWSYPSNCKYDQSPFTAGVGGLIVIEKNASDQTSGKSYSPRNSTVVIGWNNTVSWINQDDVYSSVTSDQHLFDSGSIRPGESWQHSFECLGTYRYHSEPHPWMLGVIRVLLHS